MASKRRHAEDALRARLDECESMQREIVDIALLEQRRVREELHDSTQQDLAGLGLLAQGLSEALKRDGLASPGELAARVARGLAEANLHVREIARGLLENG